MSISEGFLLLLCALNLVFAPIPIHGQNEQTTEKLTWIDYTPFWCTKNGRQKLSEQAVPKSEECIKLCVHLNPDCKAVEWWEKAGGLCFECIRPSSRRRYLDHTDLAHPPHVYVKEQSRALNKCEPNLCENGATCTQTDRPKGYKCTCRPGYEGINCETDDNECVKQNGGCSHKCTNTFGSYTCSCPDPELNLAPDRRTCVASGVAVHCHQNDMSITLPKALLLGLNREHVTLRDVNCVATETSTHYTLKTTLTGCGTIARHRKGVVVYSNTVLEIPVANDAIITRVREIEIPFSCYYTNSGDATAVGVKPDSKKLVFDEDGKGNFTVALDIFPDDKFSSAYALGDYPVEVKLTEYIDFQASVKSNDKRLSVLVENCYATPSQEWNNTVKYYLIKDGCPVDKTTVILKSPQVGVDRFKTESFKFIADHPLVFVNCDLRICEAGNPNARCPQGCVMEARKRREVSTDKLYPLIQGPLTISSDETEKTGVRKSTLHGATVPAVLAMAVLSALCIVGMIWLSRKKPIEASAYTSLMVTSDD